MRLARAACIVAAISSVGVGETRAQDGNPTSAAAPSASSAVEVFTELLRDQRVSALLRLDYFQSSRTLSDRENLVGGSLQLKALPRLSSNIDGKIEARWIDSDLGHGSERGRNRLLEAYVTVHFSK